MSNRLPLSADDLRGAARLAIDATLGVTGIVETMHARIAGGRDAERARGLTGFVYRCVRGVTRIVDRAIALAPAERLLGTNAPDSDARAAVLAALNGVVGDRLVATANPLAQPMTIRIGPRAIDPETRAIRDALDAPSPRLLVLVHGLCMNDRQWTRDGHDHGRALADDAGWTPVYLRYNTGLAIGANGRELARVLGTLRDAWPVPLEEIAIVGHSMGGLVARAALDVAETEAMRWLAHARRVVFLGTPHGGAPLERGGHGVDRLLAAHRLTEPFSRIGRLRSRGIVDLRHGRVREDGAPAVPLPGGIVAHAVAGRIGLVRLHDTVGDGLVPVDSALGRGPRAGLDLPAERTLVASGVGHLALLSDRRVYAALRGWLA